MSYINQREKRSDNRRIYNIYIMVYIITLDDDASMGEVDDLSDGDFLILAAGENLQ